MKRAKIVRGAKLIVKDYKYGICPKCFRPLALPCPFCDEPIFEVRQKDSPEKPQFMIWANGRIAGFPEESSIIINRIDFMIAANIEALLARIEGEKA